MMGLVFALLMLLGCLLISVCITVLTFTAVELRRVVTKLAIRLDELAERNYQATERNFAVIGELRKWQQRSDDEGESTVRKNRPS
jgi:hypothetical protein